jgi:glutathione S-transferase
MKLYYVPGACSQAANIAMREAGIKFELVKVDRHTKRAADGRELKDVNPKAYVPALTLDSGEVLTENDAVLQYIGDRNPAAKLAPPAGTMERYHLMEWLAFISTELHKGFTPMFRAEAPEEAKQYSRKVLTGRLEWLNSVIGAHTFLQGEDFTVADCYLFVVLSWGAFVKLDIGQWPQLKRYFDRIAARPHVVEAQKAEGLVK